MISRDRFDLRTSGVNLASPVVKIDYSNSFAYMGLKFLKWNHHSGCCSGHKFTSSESSELLLSTVKLCKFGSNHSRQLHSKRTEQNEP